MNWKFYLRRIPWLTLLLLVSTAYSGPRAGSQRQHAVSWSLTLAGATSAMYGDPCEMAAELRGKVTGVLAQGRLDRTIRLIQKANRLCASSAYVTWGQEVSTLAELGRYVEARALAKTIEADTNAALDAKNAAWKALALCALWDNDVAEPDQAKATMRRLFEEATKLQNEPDENTQRRVKETFLAAWETWHPNAKALASAGLAAKKLGQYAEAQRLFDRALVDAEKEYGQTVALELPGMVQGFAEVVAWSMDGQLVALYNGQSISIFDRTWRLRLRIQAPTFGIHDTFSVPGEPIIGHWGPEPQRALDVKMLLFSPDGKTLISGGHHDHGIILWDIASGKELQAINVRAHKLHSIAYSADSKTLAASLSDGSVWIWDVVSGNQLHMFKGQGKPTSSVAYSPDGKTLAAASDDNWVRVWDVVSGKQLHALVGHTARINSVVYAPDGKTLASASDDNSVRVWDVVSGKQLQSLEHGNFLRSVVYSPDGKTLAAPTYLLSKKGADGATMLSGDTVHFWSVATGESIGVLHVGGHVRALMYSPEGTILVALGGEGNVTLRENRPWQSERGKERKSLIEYQILANGGHVSPDGEVVMTGFPGEPLVARETATGKVLHVFGEYSNSSRALAYSPDGKTLASGMEDNTVRVWDAHSGELVRTLAGHTRTVRAVAYSRDGDKLVSGSSDKTVRLWDVASGKELRQFVGHTKDVYSVAYSPDGLSLASGSADATVRVWDVTTGKERQTLSEHDRGVDEVAYSPNGKILASVGDRVLLWDTEGRQALLGGYLPDSGKIRFLPDGMTLAVRDSYGVRFWKVMTGEETSVFGHWLGDPAISPDFKTLAGDGEDNSHVVVRDIRGTERMKIKTYDCPFRGMGFSPDGGTFACGARNGAILLFDMYEGGLGATLRDSGIPGASYVYTPSGHIDVRGPQACAARDKLACRVGPVFFPFDVCEERLFVADLLTHQQRGGMSYAEPEVITQLMRCGVSR